MIVSAFSSHRLGSIPIVQAKERIFSRMNGTHAHQKLRQPPTITFEPPKNVRTIRTEGTCDNILFVVVIM